MNIPIVKEHGSWVVFIFSCFAGIITGLLTHPWDTGRDFSSLVLYTTAGLVFAVNSKSPLVSFLRTGSGKQRREHLLWFIFFSTGSFILLIPFLYTGIKQFLIFSPVILIYAIFLFRGREHYLFAELTGFALLTLSAPVIYFTITGNVSLKLYLAVFIFFAAGVFKVRVRIKKTIAYRRLMVLYCAASVIFFYSLYIPVIILLPFVENIISVIMMRDEKLRTTGNIELIKGIIFTGLLGFFW